MNGFNKICGSSDKFEVSCILSVCSLSSWCDYVIGGTFYSIESFIKINPLKLKKGQGWSKRILHLVFGSVVRNGI